MALPPCDARIYRDGVMVGIIDSLPAETIEQIVCDLRHTTQAQVDWHYFGGRAIIKALDHLEHVRESLRMLGYYVVDPTRPPEGSDHDHA